MLRWSNRVAINDTGADRHALNFFDEPKGLFVQLFKAARISIVDVDINPQTLVRYRWEPLSDTAFRNRDQLNSATRLRRFVVDVRSLLRSSLRGISDRLEISAHVRSTPIGPEVLFFGL